MKGPYVVTHCPNSQILFFELLPYLANTGCHLIIFMSLSCQERHMALVLHGHGCLSSDGGIQLSKFFVGMPNTYWIPLWIWHKSEVSELAKKKKKDMGVQVTLHDAKHGAECSPKALFWIKIHSVAHKDYHIFFFNFFLDLSSSLNSNFFSVIIFLLV